MLRYCCACTRVLHHQHDLRADALRPPPRQYDSVKDLRYGHLMIMTDQDHDGSHIKGLIINMFQCFWPSLMR